MPELPPVTSTFLPFRPGSPAVAARVGGDDGVCHEGLLCGGSAVAVGPAGRRYTVASIGGGRAAGSRRVGAAPSRARAARGRRAGRRRTDSSPAPISAALAGGVDEPEVHADRGRGDDERQRRRLHDPGDRRVRAVEHAAVHERGQPADDEQRGEEDRHHREVRRRRRERVEVEAHAARHEEDRDEEAEADRLELAPEVRMGHHLVASTSETIAPAMNAPRIASSPSCWAIAAKPTNSTSAARTRICAVVSCRRSRSARIRAECSAPRTTTKHDAGEREQRAEQQQRRAGAALAGEEDRQQDDRAEVGDRRRGDDELAERRGDLAGVLEHRARARPATSRTG